MAHHGPENVTMLQIAEHADLGAGTVYNYFTSKDEIVKVVLERLHVSRTEKVRAIVSEFDDPVDASVFVVRAAMIIAALSPWSSSLIHKSAVAADNLYSMTGPILINNLLAARETGLVKFDNAQLTWRLVSHAVVGFGIEVRRGRISMDDLSESLICLLGMFGMAPDTARKYAEKDWPEISVE